VTLRSSGVLAVLAIAGLAFLVFGRSETKSADLGVGLITGAVVGAALLAAEIERTNRDKAEQQRIEEWRLAEERRTADQREADRRQQAMFRREDQERQERAIRGLLVQQLIAGTPELRGLNLASEHLPGLYLMRRRVDDGRFQGSDLRRSNFTQAELRYCIFESAALREASFDGARVVGCDFAGADMTAVQLEGATFVECMFQAVMASGHAGTATFERCEDVPSVWLAPGRDV
jgi:uncharacterized protein YjbI with pentapeptide repeats